MNNRKKSRTPVRNASDDSELWLSKYQTLRTLIGVLGMLLPLLLMGVIFIDTPDWYFNKSFWDWPIESISHYYYTRADGAFVIILSLLAIFLIIYKDEDPIDFWLSTIAGFFALCVVMFPTDNLLEEKLCITSLNENRYRIGFHYVSAAIFLLCLAVMALCLFTKSDEEAKDRGRPKRRRNRVYRVCGFSIILAVCVVFFGGPIVGWIPEKVYTSYKLTFWMETVAVESFGFAWMVKGGVFLRDKPAPDTDETFIMPFDPSPPPVWLVILRKFRR